MKQSTKKTSPWAWIPTLYFAQGLPYVAVMTISVIMYKRLGRSNTDMALPAMGNQAFLESICRLDQD